jgi:hypothetical protein
MTALKVGSELTDIGFRLISELGVGNVGRRWRVQPCESEPDQPIIAKLAEIVEVNDEDTEALCDNISKLAGGEFLEGVGSVIATHWSGDKTFAVIFDIDPTAKNIAPAVAPYEFWHVAHDMVQTIQGLHSHEIVHSAINPDAIYLFESKLVLGDLWWAHREDGEPLVPSFANAYRKTLSERAKRFAAPEIMADGLPSRASDIYSLGKLWYYVLTGVELGAATDMDTSIDGKIRRLLEEMMSEQPDSRPEIFKIEAMVLANMNDGSEEQSDYLSGIGPFELTNELFLAGALVPPEIAVTILDMYSFANVVQIGVAVNGHDQWLTMEGIATQNGANYIAISHAAEMDEGKDTLPLAALRIEDNTLFTLTADELDAVFYNLHISVQQQRARDKRYVESIIGPVKEWK